MKKVLICLLLLFCNQGFASAYGTLSIGSILEGTIETDKSYDIESGGIWTFAVGIQDDMDEDEAIFGLRGEIEGIAFWPTVVDSSLNDETNYGLMLNVYTPLKVKYFVPYIGVGGGGMLTANSSFGLNAYQVMLGGEIRLLEMIGGGFFSVGAEIRYTGIKLDDGAKEDLIAFMIKIKI